MFWYLNLRFEMYPHLIIKVWTFFFKKENNITYNDLANNMIAGIKRIVKFMTFIYRIILYNICI